MSDNDTALRRDETNDLAMAFSLDCAYSLNESATCYNTIIPRLLVIITLQADSTADTNDGERFSNLSIAAVVLDPVF